MATVDRTMVCIRLNDAAGRALLEHDFGSAAVLLRYAARFAATREGRQTLRARALEAMIDAEMQQVDRGRLH